MSISAIDTKIPDAIGVEVAGNALFVQLSNGSKVSIPVDQYPRLAHATAQERANWKLIGGGHGIHWEDIDEDISVEGILARKRSAERRSSLDRWIMTSRQPRFCPWKGEGYGKANELGLPARLLILGKSHWGKESKGWGNEFTQTVVRDYLENGGYAFFTKVVHTVLGPDTVERKDQFFNSIAFYNFVQRSVGDASDIPPTKEMWEEAAAPFRATLEFLRPTHIVACGMRLWDNMPGNDDCWTPPPEALIRWIGSRKFPTARRPEDILGCYRHSEGKSIVLAIQSPSWRWYKSRSWHPVVKRFLKYDGSRKT